MIKFFRKIRQKLLDEGKLRQYLVYATGEILLVMIGILLALQVNNLNERRKDSKLELEILIGIKNDLNDNINRLDYRISTDSLVVAYADQLIKILENDTSKYDESMDVLFGHIEAWQPFHATKLAYTNLQSNGLSIITNDTLRSKIAFVFDEVYVVQDDIEKVILEIYSNGLNINYKYLATGNVIFRKSPNDFETLRKNDEFKNYLKHTMATRKQLKYQTDNTVKVTTIELRDQIIDEIKRLEK